VVGLGLALAGLLSRAWVRAAAGAVVVERTLLPGERIEGGELVVDVHVRRRGLVGGSIVVRQRLGGEEREVSLRRSSAEIVFSELPRGRHLLTPLEIVLTDPLGLERVEQRLAEQESILIRPRVPVLEFLFSTHGARDAGAARSSFRRPTGFEIHAIRDYAPGEPLRAVHWPSTARRGRLMVKELDDAPRDDIAVVLDQDLDGVAGPLGRSSFDAAVRAAGAVALAHVLWNRRVALVGTAPASEAVRVHSVGHDWEIALDALAEVMPEAGAHADRALRSPAAAVSRAREIVVVTSRPERVVDALLELRRNGRSVSLVVVASETYAGRPRNAPDVALLRAGALGLPMTVVAADRTIESALAGQFEEMTGA
jgi:uncharacterized protein (DUF58 family)